MKTYRLIFTSTCPNCNRTDRRDIRGMGESHVDWLKTGKHQMTCPGCGKDVEAVIRGSAEQEGVKR